MPYCEKPYPTAKAIIDHSLAVHRGKAIAAIRGKQGYKEEYVPKHKLAAMISNWFQNVLVIISLVVKADSKNHHTSTTDSQYIRNLHSKAISTLFPHTGLENQSIINKVTFKKSRAMQIAFLYICLPSTADISIPRCGRPNIGSSCDYKEAKFLQQEYLEQSPVKEGLVIQTR